MDDAVDRSVLDFDFEKTCSVSLNKNNVYVCLKCGIFISGRGKGTPAFNHSLEKQHQLFMHLETLKAYSLPDNVEVIDSTLDDIRYAINPTFDLNSLIRDTCYDLNGNPYIPGFIGLNISGSSDYLVVLIYALMHIPPLRDRLLTDTFESPLASALSQLTRKVWSPKLFRNHASPHLMIESISVASKRQFSGSQRQDPFRVLPWFLHSLAKELLFLGQLIKGVLIQTEEEAQLAKSDFQVNLSSTAQKKLNFSLLAFDLPQMPLFNKEEDTLTVSVEELLKQYQGQKSLRDGKEISYEIERAPAYLFTVYKRFPSNKFGEEKNKAIIRFPLKNLKIENASYSLLVNICYDESANGYFVQILSKKNGKWYSIRDLEVKEVLAHEIALSQTCIQLWERQ